MDKSDTERPIAQSAQQAQLVEQEESESAPFICYQEAALSAMEQEGQMTTQQAIKKGYCVLDGGATKTLGSIKALQAVMDINQTRYGSSRLLEVDTATRPMFSFGNSSENRCASTVELGIRAGDQEGRLKVHALDQGEGPILLSVSSLRAMGALVDFANDLVVFRHLDAQKVIPVRRSQTGHQLLPLVEDLFDGALKTKEPVPDLKAFVAEA